MKIITTKLPLYLIDIKKVLNLSYDTKVVMFSEAGLNKQLILQSKVVRGRISSTINVNVNGKTVFTTKKMKEAVKEYNKHHTVTV